MGFGQAAGQHLVHPAAVEVHHLEAPVAQLHNLTQRRQVLEGIDDETGHRFVAPLRWQGEADQCRHLVHRHVARQQPRAIIALHGALASLFLRLEAAGYGTQQVGRSDEAEGAAIFVLHEGNVDRRAPEQFHGLQRRH